MMLILLIMNNLIMKHVINWYVIDDCMSDRLTV